MNNNLVFIVTVIGLIAALNCVHTVPTHENRTSSHSTLLVLKKNEPKTLHLAHFTIKTPQNNKVKKELV